MAKKAETRTAAEVAHQAKLADEEAARNTPATPAVKEKAGGRQIGSWFADANAQGGTDQEIADRINAMASEANKDYSAVAEKVAEWRAKQNGEPRQRRTPSGQPSLFTPPIKTEPTISDLRAVKDAVPKADRKAFHEMLAKVKGLADSVGGLDKLADCLEFLAE